MIIQTRTCRPIPFYNHGDCNDDGNNQGVGWSSCAYSNFETSIYAQEDQATFSVNFKCLEKYNNEHNLLYIYSLNLL